MLDSLAPSPELEDVLLRAWLGRAPDEVLRARLELVRAFTRLYYAGVLLSASAAAAWVTRDTDLSAPTLQAFQRAIHEGQLKPGAPETKHILGKMFLASFLSGVAPPDLTTPSNWFEAGLDGRSACVRLTLPVSSALCPRQLTWSGRPWPFLRSTPRDGKVPCARSRGGCARSPRRC